MIIGRLQLTLPTINELNTNPQQQQSEQRISPVAVFYYH